MVYKQLYKPGPLSFVSKTIALLENFAILLHNTFPQLFNCIGKL